jgi:hypothetical protein
MNIHHFESNNKLQIVLDKDLIRVKLYFCLKNQKLWP